MAELLAPECHDKNTDVQYLLHLSNMSKNPLYLCPEKGLLTACSPKLLAQQD